MKPADAALVVAMSGGVDSSLAAALLQADGVALVGMTMQLWNQRRLADQPGMGINRAGRCCSLADVHDARRVAEHLRIPHYVVNYEDRFEETVVENFVEQYLAGRTPIPCSHCNTAVKFDQLLTTARQIGAGSVATGHYARVVFNGEGYELHRAVDESKDQTFFLWGLNQEQLAGAQFPLGGLRKTEVRVRAAALKLPVANKPDSNEICFVPSGDYGAFISAYMHERGRAMPDASGDVVSPEGKVLAHHDGIQNFTVGQRKGLGVATGEPLYVLAIHPSSRRVVVGDDRSLYGDELRAERVHWISGEAPRGAIRVEARIRHRHTPAPAWAEALPGERLEVRFDTPQRAITPGQSVVLYQGERVLGGGWIS